jgi:hypothetical protein
MTRRHERACHCGAAGYGVYFLPNLPTLPDHAGSPVGIRVLGDPPWAGARFDLPIAHQDLPSSPIDPPTTGASR